MPNQRKCLVFAREHINKPISFWENVIWPDKSKLELKNAKE